MLQLIKEAFYDMALFVVVIVAFPRVSSIDFGWNDHCSAILSYVGEMVVPKALSPKTALPASSNLSNSGIPSLLS